MLYSPAANIAFAHYPKTAGHTLAGWFQKTLPDARFIDPPTVYTISHFAVRPSLERLGLSPRPRSSTRSFASLQGARPLGPGPCTLRIIGVVREPFEMLVSLYEYWRSFTFRTPPTPEFIRAARERPFREFLELAVVQGHAQNYHEFFDVGGPAWPATHLLDFEHLEPALREVCRRTEIPVPQEPLSRLNRGPNQGRDLTPYRDEAGTLIEAVRSHFRWYYTEGVHLLVRGERGAA
jgi:hypothetical protein